MNNLDLGWNDLKRIINERKKRPAAEDGPNTAIGPEIEEAKALYYHLKELHDEAHAQREKEWWTRHPNEKHFLPSPEEIKRDTTFNEWIFNFVDKLRSTPEQRYQRARNPEHGFGHKPTPEGVHEWSEGRLDRPCVPGCRFWPKEGRIDPLEILEDYKEFDQYNEVRKVWKELPLH